MPEDPGQKIRGKWCDHEECTRSVWAETGYCIWHAQVDGKPLEKLIEARSEEPENLADTYIKGVNIGDEISFKNCDLSRSDFLYVNLERSNFSGANLSRANFSRSNLSRANLSRANLSEADLSEADLSEAWLWRTNLSEADLSWTDLSGARFWETDLTEMDHKEEILQRVAEFTPRLIAVELYQSQVGRIDVWKYRIVEPNTGQEYSRLKVESDIQKETVALLWNTDLGIQYLLRSLVEQRGRLTNLYPLAVTKLKLADSDEDSNTEEIAKQIEEYLRANSDYEYDVRSISQDIQIIGLKSSDFGLFWGVDPFPELEDENRHRFRLEFPLDELGGRVVTELFELFSLGSDSIHTDSKSKIVDTIRTEVTE